MAMLLIRGNTLKPKKSMHVRPESVTHLVVKFFNVKSKFDYIDKNKQKSEIEDCKQRQVWEAKLSNDAGQKGKQI
jgi:hypothetical protein